MLRVGFGSWSRVGTKRNQELGSLEAERCRVPGVSADWKDEDV